MPAILNNTLFLFLIAISSNLIALALMPQTNAYTRLWPTLIVILAFNINAWMLARIIHSGINLGILVPLLTAIIPLGAIAIGIIYYGESVNPIKLICLLIACSLVVVASKFS